MKGPLDLTHHKQYAWRGMTWMLALFSAVLILTALIRSAVVKADTTATALFDPYSVYPVAGYGQAVAIGDFNHDARNDVAMTTIVTANKLYLFSQGAAHTLTATDLGDIPANSNAVVAGDFNQDQRTDLAYASRNTSILYTRLQNASSALDAATTSPTAAGANRLVVADFNQDNRQDIAVAHYEAATFGLFLQQANGNFTSMSSYPAGIASQIDLAAGDFNADGRKDVVLLNSSQATVLIQDNTGGFTSTFTATFSLASGLAAGDLTGDGLDDFVVTYGGNRPTSKVALFAQTSGGGFVQSAVYDSYDVPQTVKFADMNMDGRLDVIVIHAGWMKLGVYLQQAAGGLAAEELYSIPYIPTFGSQSMAIGDVTGDGLPDVVIAGFDNGLIVLPHKAPATPTPTASPTATLAPPTVTPLPSPTPISSIQHPLLYLSFQSSAVLNGMLVADEDVAAYDSLGNQWSLVFDGSPVGLSLANLNATQIEADGSILFTVVSTSTVPGVGQVTPADVVRFVPTSLGKGTATQGTYQLVLDGSDVGLETFTTSGIHEGIDALGRAPDGRLLISTAGSFVVPGASGDDEDLLAFTPTSLGDNTAGTWSFYFDGSDVELGEYNEDLQNLWVDPAGNLYIMAEGATINGNVDDGDDVWVCHPLSLGENSQCQWQRFWDGDAYGVGTKVVNALDIAVAPPPLPTATATVFATKTPTLTPTNTPQPTPTPLPSPTPAGGVALYINIEGSGTIANTPFTDEDILAQNLQTGAWSLIFDGSNVGIPDAAQIDALSVESDGSLLLSFAADTTLPNLGLVAAADIVRFVPISLGSNTTGNFSLYFDGSDVELTASGENIDGIAHAPDGQLLISVSGSMFAGGISGSDEDLLAFAPTSLGDTTSGSWQLYFDGSDVGLTLASEDIQGAWAGNGELYLSMEGSYDTPDGLGGDGNDILVCTPSSLGSRTACAYRRFWDGSTQGLGSNVIGGMSLGPVNLPGLAGVQNLATARTLENLASLPSLAAADEELVLVESSDQQAETTPPGDDESVSDPQDAKRIPDLKDASFQMHIYLPMLNR
ncbi:MAG: VCBS repeat-containing protein [Caldilineaceae bacterium]